MVQVGVDLRKRMSQIAVLTEEGEIAQRRLANEPERLEAFFAQLPHGRRWPSRPRARGGGWWICSSARDIARCCVDTFHDRRISGRRMCRREDA